ncbi:hypothetical protein Q8A67_004672 [Cirrhinus molitorella]|nr:hypothetical protein Q8A67_004672 [Cirrhinus molitorella]
MGGLRFPAFLLVLLYTTVVQITGEEIKMGMFSEGADYSFQHCRKEMLQMVTKTGGLLETELKNNNDFKTMWNGNAICNKVIPEVTPKHVAALKNYADASPEFKRKFKKLVHTSRGNSTFQDEFPFKSLFFLLTDAIQLIGKNKCRTVFFGTVKDYITKTGEKVRFESFLPAKKEFTVATEDAYGSESTGTVLNITSCSVISLEDHGCSSEESELLISPTEVFTVTDIRSISNNNDEYKEIAILHSHIRNSSNCSGLARLPEETKESSSSFLSSSLLNLMASLLLYFNTMTL